jgi:hypothetical protein
MPDAAQIGVQFARCLAGARRAEAPFRHWLVEDVLPAASCDAIRTLPFAPPSIADTLGKRETHNSTRLFFSAENRVRFPVCAAIAEVLQGSALVDRLEALCGARLRGSFLRIEYCQDTDGFWLEPHTDIGAKLFTMLVYLSEDQGAEGWGTDLFDQARNLVGTVPFRANCGLIFVPGEDTWHGFRRRSIIGVRRSIIINYVKDEWRARHELAYPDRPVSRG